MDEKVAVHRLARCEHPVRIVLHRKALEAPPCSSGQRLPTEELLALNVAFLSVARTYFVDFGPVFFIYFCARDTGKASEKPFSISVSRIDRGLTHDLAIAQRDVIAKKKSFTVARSGASTPSRRQ